MHCNLRPPDAAPVVGFNNDAHTKVQVRQPIRCCLIAFSADTLCCAVILTFDFMTLTCDPLTLGICNVSAVTFSNSVPNLSDIEQSAVQLL